jgi:hypothetical protein
MDMSNSERFFELVKWFNNFSTQLSILYNKISEAFSSAFKLKETKRYVNFSSNMPLIPDIFHMGFIRKQGFSIDVMTVFNKDNLSNDAFEKTASIIIARIEGGNGYFDESMWNIFSEDNLTLKRTKEGFIKGKIKAKGGDMEFIAFQVDLEFFNNKNAEEIIRKEISPKINKLVNL